MVAAEPSTSPARGLPPAESPGLPSASEALPPGSVDEGDDGAFVEPGPWLPPERSGSPPGADGDAEFSLVVRSAAPPDDAGAANRVLLSLLLSLVGFLVVAAVLYEFKFHEVTDSLFGVPTRVVFVLGVALAVAPFFVTVFYRVPLQFLALPILLLFFLYPIFSPHGVPYDRDSIYVLQFSRTLLTSHTWIPGAGVTQQAIVYSYYPGAAIFNAEAASLTSTSLTTSVPWATELFRLLMIPPLVYAVTARLFRRRAAPLAVLLYAVEASIEMNVPTQQDFAVNFVLLTVGVLAFLAVDAVPGTDFLRLSLIMSTALVIVSHHVSTYILIGILGGFALLPRILWRRDPFPNAHSMSVFLRTLAFGVLWGLIVALPVLRQEGTTLAQNLSAVFRPGPASTAVPGSSFPLYDSAWVGFGVL
ncbi:MAG: hypothetical protein ACREC5_00825, partial [Thermoplasmata archaeon]